MTAEYNPLVQQTLDSMNYLKDKNLRFFEKHYRNVYEGFKDYKFEKLKIHIDNKTAEINLIDEDGNPIYQDNAIAYAQKEVEIFKKEFFAKDRRLVTIAPATSSLYSSPRFFHKRLRAALSKSPFQSMAQFLGYNLPRNKIPLIVFMGVGLGQHIELMIQEKEFLNVMIYEPNPDYFYASLYTTDWEAIATSNNRVNDQSKSVHLILGRLTLEQNQFASIWNNLVLFCPFFPIATLFYNHLGRKENLKLVTRVNQETNKFMSIFGYYDDEINQINNVLHNTSRNLNVIKKTNLDIKTPVFILGSGPSLDRYLAIHDEIKDRGIIVSCGSALSALYPLGIKPDFHVEIESDFATFETLKYKADPEWTNGITFLGATQLNPLCFNFFNKSYGFIKNESSSKLLFEENSGIMFTAPSCTNAATAFFLEMGFKNVILCGCDFGYKSQEKHHSDAVSIYKSKNQYSEHMGKMIKDGDLKIPSIDGGEVVTTRFYYTCWSSLEALTTYYKGTDRNVYNFSLGAKIRATDEIAEDDIQSILHTSEISKEEQLKNIDQLFRRNLAKLPNRDDLVLHSNNISDYIAKILNHCYTADLKIESWDDITVFISRLILLTEQNKGKKWQDYYWLLRGIFWHYFFSGYSNTQSLTESEAVDFFNEFIEDMKNVMIDITYLFRDELLKDRREYDSLIFKTIIEPAEGSVPPEAEKTVDTKALFESLKSTFN